MSEGLATQDAFPSAAVPAKVAGEVILEGRDIVKTYDMGDRGLQVLRGVSIEVRKGEILAIQGPSGAGKSTLLHVLGLLDEPDSGEVRWKGENVLARNPYDRACYRNENIGFVFQFYHLFPDLSALENVCLPKMVALGTFDYRSAEEGVRQKAAALLKLVGLEARSGHLPNELSGGERQRVAIARALMNDPEVVLCDEPTGNLDQKTSAEILELLWRINRETGRTFVIVTHDVGLAQRAHRSVSVIDGVLAPTGTPVKPRGFAQTRYRLTTGSEAIGRPHAALVFALLFVLPLAHLLWVPIMNGRFRRASRRGRSAGEALAGFLVPLLGQLAWPSFVHWPMLSSLRRILIANEEPAPERLSIALAVLLYGIDFPFTLVSAVFALSPDTPSGQRDQWIMGLIAGSAILAAVVAWIQAQLNAFLDRMSPREPAE